jgi:hypothetical protein
MKGKTYRRRFLKRAVAVGAGFSLASLDRLAEAAPEETTQPEPNGFFTLGRQDDHWWLLTPDRKPFFNRAEPHRPGEPEVPREHSNLAGEIRRKHVAVDQGIRGA